MEQQNKLQLQLEQQKYLKIVGEPNIVIRKAHGSIAKRINETGLNTVENQLLILVNEFLKHFNYSRMPDSSQIVTVLDNILLDRKHWSLLDVNECFKRAISGNYGGFYEGIDAAKIIGIFAKYEAEREEELYQDHLNKKNSEPEQPIKDLSADWLKKLSEKYSVKELPKTKAIKEKSEQDKLIYSYFKEFDAIYNKMYKNKRPPDGQRFIEYKGRVVSVTEYCEIRVVE